MALPYFILGIIIELIMMVLRGQRLPRFNDSLSSVTAGVYSKLIRLIISPFFMTGLGEKEKERKKILICSAFWHVRCDYRHFLNDSLCLAL